MKQYNDINTKKNVELKPEKKQRSYDISSELGIKQEPIKSSRKYDINKDSKKKSHKILIILFIMIILLFSASAALMYFGYIDVNSILNNNNILHTDTENSGVSESSNDDDDLKISQCNDMFTFIDGSEVITLGADETLVFRSNPSNTGKGISIEFIIKDTSTGEYYCDNTISDDGSFEWKPSDYIHDTNVEHVIGISQKAFKSNDLSTPIGSYYSTITIKLTD